MQRWLAGRTPNPTASILIGLAMTAVGIWWSVSQGGTHRLVSVAFTLVGALNCVIGIAALRERRTASVY